ncbi:hypothetical protein HWV62_29252 [Athelia sp. TMB]|nr:hypothetical protein HWV62_29252 [Athelia sp. TMB]
MNTTGSPNDPRTPRRDEPTIHFASLASPFKYMTPAELRSIYGVPTRVASSPSEACTAVPPDRNASSPPAALGNASESQKPSKTRRIDLERVGTGRENVPPVEDTESRSRQRSAQPAKRKPDKARQETQGDEGSGEDADEEDTPRPCKRAKRSKKKKVQAEEVKVLSTEIAELKPKQIATRKELKSLVRVALIEATGYQRPETEPPANTSSAQLVPFNFEENVTSPTNSRIINKVAKLVNNEQRDLELSSLTYAHTKVHWTKCDLTDFAKDQFRTWKALFQATTSEQKAKAAARRKRKNKRDVRRTHLAEDRQAAAVQYKELHGKDPTPYIDEAWMSDQVSAIETEDEEKAAAYLQNLHKEAGFSERDIAEELPVWEVIKKGFRSEHINDIITELDRIRAIDRRKSKKKNVRVRRVELGQVDNSIPSVQVYQSMVDFQWFEKEVEEKGLEGELMVIDEASGLTEEEENDDDKDDNDDDDDSSLPGTSRQASSGADDALDFPSDDE